MCNFYEATKFFASPTQQRETQGTRQAHALNVECMQLIENKNQTVRHMFFYKRVNEKTLPQIVHFLSIFCVIVYFSYYLFSYAFLRAC